MSTRNAITEWPQNYIARFEFHGAIAYQLYVQSQPVTSERPNIDMCYAVARQFKVAPESLPVRDCDAGEWIA